MNACPERSQWIVSGDQPFDADGGVRALAQVCGTDRVNVVPPIGLAVRAVQALVSIGFGGEIPGALKWC